MHVNVHEKGVMETVSMTQELPIQPIASRETSH